ncbi:MAG: DNA polymerase sliding clamp [archaeon]|nr:DNA polymerase sliding clamp [archaeon]
MMNVAARQELMSKIVDTLGVVVEDAKFEFKSDGLHTRVVDASHVAMIKLDVDSAAFETWELDDVNLGLELKKIKEFVSLGGPTDLIEMSWNDASGELSLNLGLIDKTMRPIDESAIVSPQVPPLEQKSTVKINGAALATALQAARQVGDLVSFSLDSDHFTIHVQGNSDSVTVKFGKDQVESIKCDNPIRSQYSLTYLVPLAKVFKTIESVHIGFGDSYPLSLQFTFQDGAGEVQYFLAPRVENEF